MEPGEENEICDLVIHTFNEFIADLYSRRGVRQFLRYIKPRLLLQRSKASHFVMVAETQEKIVGMIEVRNYDHISLFYVLKEFQMKGISRELLRRTEEMCLKNKPDLDQITVNSSPNAVQIYEKLGFHKIGSEQVRNGITFTPMIFELKK
jgi:GNAT superfamily N-acetyltransferase